jgi:subtilisin family serine protease
MTKRRAVLGALSVVVASVVLTLAAGGGVAAEGTTNLQAPRVHPNLLDQLQANPTDGVAAVVTLWNRDALGAVSQIVDGTQLKVLPMILVPSLTLAQLEALQTTADVRSVWPNEKFDLLMEDTTWITKARYVWASSTPAGGPRGFGVTGAGVELAVIDTGFDGLHEDGDNLIEYCETLQALTSTRGSVVCTPWDSSFNTAAAGPCGLAYPGRSNTGPGPTVAAPGCRNKARGDSSDPDVSHGTHVGGTVAGSGHASGGTAHNHSTIGMAPHAKLRVYSANLGSSLFGHQILSSYDDMTYKKLRRYNRVVAVNNSWGGGGGRDYDPEDPINVAVEAAWRAGILSVFAAGNSGPEHDTLSRQCVSPFAACVAATTKPDSVVMFSSRGRPSQPEDTNRNGIVGQPGARPGDVGYDPGDVAPDNHDWRLGQARGVGRYRPTIAAIGTSVNSMKAIGANIGDAGSAACREDVDNTPASNASCYVQANGTSMATPHVTGAIGLIVQAFRQGHDGRTPSPNELLDILERSANTTKLSAWDSEEQGAGRLDAYEAVKFARTYPDGVRRPNLGYPTPPYVQGAYPAAPASTHEELGCTGSFSWTAGDVDPVGFVDDPPVSTTRYGQHFIEVPENVDRLRITGTWQLGENLYLRLWRPGVNPDATPEATPDAPGRTPAFHQNRAFADQEATGLVFVGSSRFIEVRAPEETNPQETQLGGEPRDIPSGRWILRVYHRAGTPLEDPCNPGTTNPPQTVGHQYRLKIELAKVTHRPAVKIDSPPSGSTIGDRFAEIAGRAGYPPPNAPQLGTTGHSWEGITNWEARESAGFAGVSDADPDPNNPRPVLYFHGNLAPPHAIPAEAVCPPEGHLAILVTFCPFLHGAGLSNGPAGFWQSGESDAVFTSSVDRNPFDPNWVWCLKPGPFCPSNTPVTGPVSVSGPMTLVWWASCTGCGKNIDFGADWRIRLWADGALVFQDRVTATPEQAGIPSRLVKTLVLPPFTASQRITLHIDPVFVDSQAEAKIYYDSNLPCVAGVTTGPCDSHVRLPVGSSGSGPGGHGPTNVRVTDLPANLPYPGAPTTPALRVAWDRVPDATGYEVYRSTNPNTLGSRVFSGGGTPCVSPQAPTPNNPPGHDRAGLCFTDTGVSLRTTYYYRVIAIENGRRSGSSNIAYGTPTRYDRQVKVGVDRLYGPKYWEYALLPPSPNPTLDQAGTQWAFLWDTLELVPGLHDVFARSFTQGIGSTRDHAVYNLDETRNGGGEPGEPCSEVDGSDDDDDNDCDDDNDDEEEDDD